MMGIAGAQKWSLITMKRGLTFLSRGTVPVCLEKCHVSISPDGLWPPQS